MQSKNVLLPVPQAFMEWLLYFIFTSRLLKEKQVNFNLMLFRKCKAKL